MLTRLYMLVLLKAYSIVSHLIEVGAATKMTTRALYLAYYEEAVLANALANGGLAPSVARRKQDGLKAWTTLTAAERVQYPIDLDSLSAARDNRDAVLAVAESRSTRASNTQSAVPRDYALIVLTADAAADALRDLCPQGLPAGPQQNVINAAVVLSNATTVNGGPISAIHDQVRRYATNQVVMEQRKLQNYHFRMGGWVFRADNPPVPARPVDGVVKMPEDWLSDGRQAAIQQDWQTNFRTAPLPPGNPNFNSPNDNWLGTWQLGNGGGGQGAAALYVSEDVDGLVNNRVLKKSTKLSARAWASVTMIDGDVRDSSNRAPLEITCHRDMASVRGRSTQQPLVPMISASTPESFRFTYDIFMEYCPFGDLSALISRYQRLQV